MALKRLVIDGYGQIELNNCAFRRDGRIEAQCKADTTDFANMPVENGMILAVDNIKRTVKFVTDSSLPVALTYSAEHMYDERNNGLKDFALTKDEFYPRLGYLSVGDKFTENCVCYDTAEYATDSAVVSALESIDTVKMYGGVSDQGAIALSSSLPTYGPVLMVVAKTTMPDGTLGIKFQCIKD